MRRLFTITIPLLRPSIVFASSVIFLLGMGQFTVPLLLGRTEQINVLTTEMFYLTLNPPVDYGLGAVLGLPILITGIVLVVVQKYLLGDQRRYVVVSARSRNEARVTNWWSATVIFLYTFLTTILPFAALAYVSVSPFWTARMSFTNLTLRHWYAIFDNSLFTSAVMDQRHDIDHLGRDRHSARLRLRLCAVADRPASCAPAAQRSKSW